jgi:hypothetical protein
MQIGSDSNSVTVHCHISRVALVSPDVRESGELRIVVE